MAFLTPTVIAGIAASAAVAGAGTGIYQATQSQKAPELPSLPAAPDEAAAKETARLDEMRRRARRTQTILTSPQGVLESSTAQGKVLLGD